MEALTNDLVTETMPFVDTSVDVDPDVKALGIFMVSCPVTVARAESSLNFLVVVAQSLKAGVCFGQPV